MNFFELDIFPTRLFGTNLNLNTESLTKECYILKSNTEGRHFSNKGGWQSQDLSSQLLINLGLNNILNLVSKIDFSLNYYLNSLQLTSSIITNIWVNINPPQSFNEKHTHPGSMISGTYYVNIPEDYKAQIVFTRDRSFVDCNMIPFTFAKSSDGNFIPSFRNTYFFTPTNDTLLFFPSYLNHQVLENNSKEDRISISFNSILDSKILNYE